jgi:hypothetical protein
MSYKAQENKKSTAGAPLLSEPVPIFHREEVRLGLRQLYVLKKCQYIINFEQ